MPGECYPAFHMSLAVLCVLFAWVHALREIFFFIFCANVWPRIEMWTCVCRGCFIETVYAPLPLCAVCTPDVLCSSLSVTMQGRLLSTAHTHMLYYILRTFRILSQDYIIAFRSLRVFHSENSFITSNNLYSRDDNAEMDFSTVSNDYILNVATYHKAGLCEGGQPANTNQMTGPGCEVSR